MSYSGNLLVENRNGLIVAAEVFQANGTAERDAALVMLEKLPGTQPVTVGGDKGFDTQGFVAECRNINVAPHVAQNHKPTNGLAVARSMDARCGTRALLRLAEDDCADAQAAALDKL